MSEELEKRGATGTIALIVAILVILPILYVLSDGPALWLQCHRYLPEGMYETLYAPLAWACQWSRFGDALDWYESMFRTDLAPELF